MADSREKQGNGAELASCSRREALKKLFFGGAAASTALLMLSGGSITEPANAYEQAYPVELNSIDGDKDTIRKAALDLKRQSRKSNLDYAESANPLSFRGIEDVITDFMWGGALWTVGGSRSNPLVTPLANVLFDAKEEAWLKDRNDGYFGNIPIKLYPVIVLVFFSIGILVDRVVLVLTEGNANTSLQLATVSLIAGVSLELGRIFSGEKRATREEYDREGDLIQEFEAFAEKRLIAGGNCHRREVVGAFRRFYAKYRDPESEEYPLTDLEIEQLLRYWNRKQGNTDVTNAGFYQGIQINTEADAFAAR